jgi:hypothetical protein
MGVLPAVLLAAALLVPQRALAYNYTVHSSFIFARMGEHTPSLSESVLLTSLGAEQMYNLVCVDGWKVF